MDPSAGPTDANTHPPPRRLDCVRHKCRLLHYSMRTEEAYVQWIRRFILFHRKRHPAEMGVPEIEICFRPADLAATLRAPVRLVGSAKFWRGQAVRGTSSF